MTRIHSYRTGGSTMTAMGLVVACMCSAGLTGCLNPDFVNSVAGGARSTVPLAPGDTPYVHVLVINASALYTVDFTVAFTPSFQGMNAIGLGGIAPEAQTGFVLPCPVSAIGLGNPFNPSDPAIVLTPLDGSGAINIPAGAFPLTLNSGDNFNCGDTVTFTVVDDRNSGFGITVSTGRVDGTTQTGPFSGPDTFEVLQLLLLSSGTPPTQVP